jgi:hypothetical protein
VRRLECNQSGEDVHSLSEIAPVQGLAKREIFNRLAQHFKALAVEVERAIASNATSEV